MGEHKLLLTFDSYKTKDGLPPTMLSSIMTIGIVVALLVSLEQLWRYIISSNSYLHPILEVEVNKKILARHIGVDTTSCLIVSSMGLMNVHICKEVMMSLFYGKRDLFSPKDYVKRLADYHPESFMILTFFVGYQVKNMYDTLVWDDGPLFIFHHILAMASAWGGMYPGGGHYYAIFYMGISEISTGILCLLANFDEQHGIPGLDEAFPTFRMIVAILFVISFIICRAIMWPYISYYFSNDVMAALKEKDNAQIKPRRTFLILLTFMCLFLTVLQFIWLVEIVLRTKDEITKLLS